jgi:hypothetical protein
MRSGSDVAVSAPPSRAQSRAALPRCQPAPQWMSRGGRCGPLQLSTALSDDFASSGPCVAQSLDTDRRNPIHSHYPILTPMSLFHHTTPAPRNTRPVPRKSRATPVGSQASMAYESRLAIATRSLTASASSSVSDVHMKSFRLHFLARTRGHHLRGARGGPGDVRVERGDAAVEWAAHEPGMSVKG